MVLAYSKTRNGSMVPKLSIITVSYNTNDLLCQCLRSIYEHTKNLDFEVIVIDNNSKDGTIEEINREFPKIRIITNNHNKGFAAASNQGLKVMSGGYGLLLNPDTIILDNVLSKMLEFIESHKNIGILGCKILNPDGSHQRAAFPPPSLITTIVSMLNLGRIFPGELSHYYRFHLERMFPPEITNCYYDDLYKMATKPFRVGWVSGACLLIRKKTIMDIGYLDENLFLFGEEVDWCCRARQKSWGVFLFPEAKIIHYGQMSMFTFLPVGIRSSYYSRFYFAKKHFGHIAVLTLKLISFWHLLIKMIIISIKRNMDVQERKSRFLGYKESLKCIFKKIK